MAIMKGILLGLVGTLILAYLLGKGGVSSTGMLGVHGAALAGLCFYWSWLIFIEPAMLASAIFGMMK